MTRMRDNLVILGRCWWWWWWRQCWMRKNRSDKDRKLKIDEDCTQLWRETQNVLAVAFVFVVECRPEINTVCVTDRPKNEDTTRFKNSYGFVYAFQIVGFFLFFFFFFNSSCVLICQCDKLDCYYYCGACCWVVHHSPFKGFHSHEHA